MVFNVSKFRRYADICTCVLLFVLLLILPAWVLSTVKLHSLIINQVSKINLRFK